MAVELGVERLERLAHPPGEFGYKAVVKREPFLQRAAPGLDHRRGAGRHHRRQRQRGGRVLVVLRVPRLVQPASHLADGARRLVQHRGRRLRIHRIMPPPPGLQPVQRAAKRQHLRDFGHPRPVQRQPVLLGSQVLPQQQPVDPRSLVQPIKIHALQTRLPLGQQRLLPRQGLVAPRHVKRPLHRLHIAGKLTDHRRQRRGVLRIISRGGRPRAGQPAGHQASQHEGSPHRKA